MTGMDEQRQAQVESVAVWKRIAGWWDEALGEGNDFQLTLIMPATDRLLALKPGEQVLDVACGNGNYARRIARAGARVVACDVAEDFLERARKRTSSADGEIEYHLIDATDERQLLSLGPQRFDAAVCSMAVMDLPTLSPLLDALRRLLRPNGRFVFSVSHPCFNSNGSRMTAELINEAGRLEQVYGVSITRYLQPSIDRAAGILHQPEPHYTFHRPLSVLLRECFTAGFVADGFEEPAYPENSGGNPFSWKKRPQIPPALVVRLRPA